MPGFWEVEMSYLLNEITYHKNMNFTYTRYRYTHTFYKLPHCRARTGLLDKVILCLECKDNM